MNLKYKFQKAKFVCDGLDGVCHYGVESGGVIVMKGFLRKFFPGEKVDDINDSRYCQNDYWGLQLFTSSVYLAGMAATVVSAYTTRRFGRRMSMLIAGIFFLCGTAFSAAAKDLPMLIIGRLLLGFGLGFGNQVCPLLF